MQESQTLFLVDRRLSNGERRMSYFPIMLFTWRKWLHCFRVDDTFETVATDRSPGQLYLRSGCAARQARS